MTQYPQLWLQTLGFMSPDYPNAPNYYDLALRYGEPHRKYHVMNHAIDVVQLIRALGGSYEAQWAGWYHDAFYDVLRKDNELRSANLAIKETAFMKYLDHEKIHSMILASATHEATKELDRDTLIFLDADMAILGSTWYLYSRYLDDIREEYEVYSNKIFNSGRIRFLENLLGREHIYHTDAIRILLEDHARSNIEDELMSLKLLQI